MKTLYLILMAGLLGKAAADVRPVDVAKLSPLLGAQFGSASDISGSIAVISTGNGASGINSQGTQLAHIFVRDAGSGGWSPAKQISPSLMTTENLGNYGASLAVDGDTVVVGAPVLFGASPGTGYDGRVFIHKRNTGGTNQWGRVKRIDGKQGAGPEQFGFGEQVALSGDTLAVRVAGNRLALSKVRIFQRNQGGVEQWGEVATIPYPLGTPGGAFTTDDDGFAASMALDGDRLICGLAEAGTAAETGVYIYERNTGGSNAWGLARHIAPANVPGARVLGHAVALQGTRLMVSGVADAAGTLTNLVWWLVRDGAGNWNVESGQSVIDPVVGAFGRTVALTGDWATVAAHRRLTPTTRRTDVYLYERISGSWSLRSSLLGTEEPGTVFGAGDAIPGLPPEFVESFTIRTLTSSLISGDDPPLTMAGDALLHRSSVGSSGTLGGLTVRERTAGTGAGWGSVATLRPAAPFSESFGETMAADGNYLVIGDPDDDEGLTDSGAVWLFNRNTTGGNDQWILQYKIKSPTPAAGGHFGAAVALVTSGFSYTLVVGAPEESVAGVICGRVHSFGRYVDGRSLSPIDPQSNQAYGRAVGLAWQLTGDTISGVTMAAGASGHDAPGMGNAGKVEVYESMTSFGGEWGFLRQLTPSDAAAGDAFGWSVAMDGNLIAVGGVTAGSNGAAWIFQRSTGTNTFNQVGKVLPGDNSSGLFPHCLALQDNTLVGGTLTFTSGAGFVYERNQGGTNHWGLVKKLVPTAPGGTSDGFGLSVALNNDLILVGAQGDDAVADNNGAAWLYQRNRGGANQWNIAARLSAEPVESGRLFGLAVAIANDSLILGAPQDDEAGPDTGAAFVRRAGSYEFWVESTGLPAGQDLTGSDSDQDGVPNLVEFMLGTNPRLAASRTQPNTAFDRSTRRLYLGFAKPSYPQGGVEILAEGRRLDGGSFSFSNCEILENTTTVFGAQWRGTPPNGAMMRVRATYPRW
jgi:hypothetical protein